MRQLIVHFTLAALITGTSPAVAADARTNTAALPRTDTNGNPLRRAPTGHISNYDEDKVGSYTLPDPLVLQNGKTVRDAKTWTSKRRPEVLKLYETEIYGRVPKHAPKENGKSRQLTPTRSKARR